MSTTNPTRRTTRTTRTVALSNENATTAARSTRTAVLRAKPASKEVNTAGSSSRVTAATAASRAKASAPPSKSAPVMEGKEGKDSAAATKRKREALGEVTGANGKAKAPVVANSKGKATATAPTSKADKKPESVVLKAKVTASTTIIGASSSSTTTAATRPPVRVFGAATTRRSTRSTVTEDAKFVVAQDEPLDDVPEVPEEEEVIVRKSDGMEVDLPAAARRASTRNGVAAPATSKPRSSRSVRRVASKVEEEDDLEDHREHKKRRTSSEAGELDRQQVEEELNDTEEAELTRQREELVLGVVEADPDGDEWDDLDAEDIDDPQMVSEYVVEIFDYLKIVEQTTMPNPNYMESQKELAWKMRGILTDWLIQVHFRFRLLPETLFLAVNIIDRFLSSRVVSLAKLQLVGVACMFIAAKVEEIVAPSAANFLYCADSSYTEVEILQAEKYILKTLDWNLSYPNPMHFLRRVSKADEYNVQVRTIGKYLMEVSCLEWRLIAAPPSLLAAASIWLARIILGREDWTPNLAHYSSYSESQLLPTANMMLNYVLKPIAHQSFYKKYASKKYLKASVYVREWALERWEESTRVDLPSEMPLIKEIIRETNERDRAIAEANGLTEVTELENTYAP